MTNGAEGEHTSPGAAGDRSSTTSGADEAPAKPGARVTPGRRNRAENPTLPAWQETILLVGMALILALIVKTFFLQAFYIPSGSMRDTLKVDDRILVQKVTYWFGDIGRGDIVVFDDPANWLREEDGQAPSNALTKGLAAIGLYPAGGHLVKRVIGVGGDSVSCSDGLVSVNGEPLDEGDYVTLPKQACQGSWKAPPVPDDHIWVMGDNRNQSVDSRAHMGDPGGGFIPVSDVVGKVFVVIWPVKDWSFIGSPDVFDDPRLDRAAGLVISTAPGGLALVAAPALRRRRKKRISHR
ncbi:MAG: signal peptidase I [Actinomycetota bacterium]|nr:signal peptidase I [Actinomycetota bacterium]